MEQRRGDQEVEGEEVVVDAPVIVKWFVEEEYSREARLLRDVRERAGRPRGTLPAPLRGSQRPQVLRVPTYVGGDRPT